jgi:DNA-binding transcriptional MerR regulator
MQSPANNHRAASQLSSQSFSSLEVSKMTGVSLRQLQWWDEQRVVSPIQRGHRRLYHMDELIEVAMITELRRKGISLQKIRKVLKFLKAELGSQYLDALQEGGEVHLLTDGKTLYLESDHSMIVDILKNANQPLIGVCVSDQVERLTAKIRVGKKDIGRELGAARRAARAS